MKRFAPVLVPLLGLASVLVALTVTFVWPGKDRNGLPINLDSSALAQEVEQRERYDLTRLAVLNRAILEVKDHYVEPERVNPRQMLLSGLNSIQRSVAPVLVHYENGADTFEVQVNNQRREFHVDDVDAPWSLANRFREVFAFLQENLAEEDIDLRDIEYAAVNGMLRTLDPHTVLLTPDVYEEMRMSTRGEFGGLGIVISLPEGQLTIVEPMADTPASRAGLEAEDQIVKINDESTLNMPLSEAVDRLRGAPGSPVTVWIVRPGSFTQARPFRLERAVIQIESVESSIEDGVGYIRLKSFQGNTYEDMRAALAQLHRQGLRGLILDLRDNPGGLLEQAVHISDTFLTSGTIVTTSSNDPSQRDEKSARSQGTEPDYPMVVLVNGGSASASEIVAGALKAHDRAIIVGQRTFGKGSVQVLHEFQDDSALKLTIAQYLTPGDVSIQGVGIAPDIRVAPMTVDREDMDLVVDSRYVRESDLRHALTSDRVQDAEDGTMMRYYLPAETRQRLRDADPRARAENNEEDEFLMNFSRQLINDASRSNRRDIMRQAESVITQLNATEMVSAVAQLRRIGVDWSEGTDEGASAVEVVATTNRPDNTGVPGEPFELRVRVTNNGEHTLHQLRAITKSDYELFSNRELVFGKLAPGESREWSTTLGICETENNRRRCTLPVHIQDRADAIRIQFSEAHGHAPPEAVATTVVRALPRPQFSYGAQMADNLRGNGDGRLSRGEFATLYVRIKNTGPGPTLDTQANLRNLSGRGVLLRHGRFELPPLAAGEERVVEFTFEVLPDFDREEAKLEVAITDIELREAITEKINIPIVSGGNAPSARQGNVTLGDGVVVRQSPSSSAARVARVRGGGISVGATAEASGFVRVDLGGGRPGWVSNSDAQGSGSGGRLSWSISHVPPQLTVNFGNSLVTRSATMQLSGTATDNQNVRDMYVFVGSRKVVYRSNRGSETPREASFEAEIPLQGGLNYIYVFARESDDVVSRQSFVVRRDAADGTLMETPQYDDELFGGPPE